METTAVISSTDLVKRYGELTAVDKVDFTVARGQCVGILGPNGAGKTSIMKMISCVSPVTSGELLVQGKNVQRYQKAIKAEVGVVSQSDSLDPDLSVMQNLLAYGRFFNLHKGAAQERAWAALDLFQLRDKASQVPDELSGGMRRRLLIGRAMIHEPKMLVLDEPTTGLDPQSRHLVWDRLRTLRNQGITILLTTHYMEEAAYLCDGIIVMDLGKILVEGSPEKLVRTYAGEQVIQVRVPKDDRQELVERLQNHEIEFDATDDSLILYVDAGSFTHVQDLLDSANTVRRPSNLEDVFLRLTGRGLRDS